MSISRRVRRLSAPIVVTIAAAPGCSSNPPEPIHMNPPPQELNGGPEAPPSATAAPHLVRRGPIMNPPRVNLELPMPSGSGRVEHQPDGSCVQYAEVTPCPQGMACNPPPPHPVRCPP
jgi:hypothetical protein